MKKLVRTLVAGAALAMPVTMFAAPAEAVEANVFVITGSGTISPGLTPTEPRPQSVSFTGTATVVGTQAGTYPCSFSGTDPSGSTALGGVPEFGSVSGGCGPIDDLTCSFVRVGPAVEVICVDTSSGVRAAEATCVFTPVDVNPTTRYNLVCVGAYASAP